MLFSARHIFLQTLELASAQARYAKWCLLQSSAAKPCMIKTRASSYSGPTTDILRTLRSIDQGASDTRLYTKIDMHSRDTIFFAFRGTNTTEDLMANINVQPHFKFGGQLHSGFWNRATEVDIADIMEAVRTGRHVVITGHSLGGAVAQLVMLRVLEEQAVYSNNLPGGQVTCISFGAPLVMDKKATQYVVERGWDSKFFSLVNEDDIVPRAMLLKKEVFKKVLIGMKAVGLLSKAEALAQKLKDKLPWWGQIVAEIGSAAGGWYMEEALQSYQPFGHYLFLTAGRNIIHIDESKVTLQMLQGVVDMRQEQVEQHSLLKYAAALRRLRKQK